MTPWTDAEIEAQVALRVRTLLLRARRRGEPLTEEVAQEEGRRMVARSLEFRRSLRDVAAGVQRGASSS